MRYEIYKMITSKKIIYTTKVIRLWYLLVYCQPEHRITTAVQIKRHAFHELTTVSTKRYWRYWNVTRTVTILFHTASNPHTSHHVLHCRRGKTVHLNKYINTNSTNVHTIKQFSNSLLYKYTANDNFLYSAVSNLQD